MIYVIKNIGNHSNNNYALIYLASSINLINMTFLKILIPVILFISCGSEEETPMTPNPPEENDIDISEGFMSPSSYDGYDLVWQDEFDGSSLDLSKWDYDIGTGCPNLCGWGNEEKQYYRSQNVIVGNGVATIRARRESFEESDFTSGKIVTRNIQSFQYGRIDVRALLPDGGQGMWPAIWMLGINQPTVGWPSCGEIDIMEMFGGGGKENRITGNVFWEEGGPANVPSAYTVSGKTFASEYHVFSIEWDDSEIKWFVNNEEFKSFSTSRATRDAFRLPFYFIMNVAVGGIPPGDPDASTDFPTEMRVDYVRYFQKQ